MYGGEFSELTLVHQTLFTKNLISLYKHIHRLAIIYEICQILIIPLFVFTVRMSLFSCQW